MPSTTTTTTAFVTSFTTPLLSPLTSSSTICSSTATSSFTAKRLRLNVHRQARHEPPAFRTAPLRITIKSEDSSDQSSSSSSQSSSPSTTETEKPIEPTSTTSKTTSSTPTPTPTTPEEKPKPPFEIRGFSLANLFLAFGGVITLVSFSSYFNSNGTASATSLGFVYGVPILLVGCALKYAELQPIPVESVEGAPEARNAYATDTQKQIYKDITRHRYGDEAHLASAMSSLGLIPRGESCPVLERAIERVVDNGKKYQLELVFYSIATPYKTWEERKDRYDSFFGPNVTVDVKKVDASKRQVGLVITSQ